MGLFDLTNKNKQQEGNNDRYTISVVNKPGKNIFESDGVKYVEQQVFKHKDVVKKEADHTKNNFMRILIGDAVVKYGIDRKKLEFVLCNGIDSLSGFKE
jgi:hypothetical protein